MGHRTWATASGQVEACSGLEGQDTVWRCAWEDGCAAVILRGSVGLKGTWDWGWSSELEGGVSAAHRPGP